MPSLTTHVPPHKIRYHHILHDIQILFQQNPQEPLEDFKTIHTFLAQHYGLPEKDLLLQGMRRAYRQIVEGV